jgi:hypothetical protein
MFDVELGCWVRDGNAIYYLVLCSKRNLSSWITLRIVLEWSPRSRVFQLQVFVAERRFLEDAEAFWDFFGETWHCVALKTNLHLQMLTSSAKLQCSKSSGTMGSTPKWRVNLQVEILSQVRTAVQRPPTTKDMRDSICSFLPRSSEYLQNSQKTPARKRLFRPCSPCDVIPLIERDALVFSEA